MVGGERWRCTNDATSSPHATWDNPRRCLRHAGSDEEDIAAPQTFHRRYTQRRHNRVIILHACLACHLCMHLAYQLAFAMLVCGCQRGCGCGYMGAYVCVHTCVLAHIAVTVPELACSHDKRCTPNLSGGARRSDSRLRPNGWLFHVAEVWSGLDDLGWVVCFG